MMKFCLGMLVVLSATGLFLSLMNDTRSMDTCLEKHSRDTCVSVLRP